MSELYIILAFIIGLDVVIATILNGKLAEKIGITNGTFINYFVAFLSSIILCFIMKEKFLSLELLMSVPLYYFISGVFGILVVFIFNIVTPNVPAVYIVILPFIGQMLTSSLLDYIVLDTFSKGKLIGGIMFFFGLIYNISIDKKYIVTED